MHSLFKISIVSLILIACNDSKPPLKLANLDVRSTNLKEPEINEKGIYTNADSIADSKVKKYRVRLVEGVNKKGGYTKVKYLNTLQLINLNKKESKKKQEEDRIIESKISYLKRNNRGGRLELIIIRNNTDSANLKNFAVIIKDLNDKEIFKTNLPATVALPSRINKHLWNSQKINIPENIRPPFNVFVFDRLNQKPFKFSVTPKS